MEYSIICRILQINLKRLISFLRKKISCLDYIRIYAILYVYAEIGVL